MAFELAVVVWTEWPRGDARFVGDWSVAVGDRQPSGKLILCRNGTGRSYEKHDSDEYVYVVWRVEGDWLIFGYPSNWLSQSVNRFWWRIAPGYVPLFPLDNPYPILDVQPDKIRIRNTWSTNTLRRLP